MKAWKKILIIIIALSIILGGYYLFLWKSTSDEDVVFMLHGLGRNKSAMVLLGSRLMEAGFHVKQVGYHSLTQSPDEILADVTQQIQSYPVAPEQTINFVGHSLGGLMIRAYLDTNEVPNLGRVVLIGTPNKGTPIVDKFREEWWMKMAGPMTLALGTDAESFPSTIGAPYYPIGLIAGVMTDLENEQFMPGVDDGVVPLESVQLEGSRDMIIFEENHTAMRFNKEISDQTIAFLINGEFNRQKE